MRIRLDLNNEVFQRQWFDLEKPHRILVLDALAKLASLSWDDLYKSKGFRWELIQSRRGPDGTRLHSLRIAKGFRAVALREGEFLVMLTLHPDHDSAYE
jgi:hypothetical protein